MKENEMTKMLANTEGCNAAEQIEASTFSHDDRSDIQGFVRVGSRSPGCGSLGVISPMNPANSEYPEKDFPWTFYFNGEAMPKWAACWGLAGVGGFVHPERDACEDVSERDLYTIMCTIDHVGFLRPRSVLA